LPGSVTRLLQVSEQNEDEPPVYDRRVVGDADNTKGFTEQVQLVVKFLAERGCGRFSEHRDVALADLYRNDGIDYLTRRPDEILTEVKLPAPEGWKSSYWKLRRRGAFDPARTALLGAFIPVATAISGVAAMSVPSLSVCILFLFLCGFFSASYNGPIYAVIVTIAGPKLRGLAVSMVQFGANLIGVSVGAYLIGAISQYVGSENGVAWGIGVAMLFTLWGALHLALASRSISRHQSASQ